MAIGGPSSRRRTAATTKQPSMVRDYWPRYRRRALLTTILMQVTVTLVIGVALIGSGVIEVSAMFFVMLLAILSATTGLNILLVSQLALPFKDVTSALTHISGEPTIVTPPNPNAHHFERDGFKPVLQLIYSLAATSPTSSDVATPELTNLATALDHSTLGFIILDAKRKVIYANKSAPVRTDVSGETIIDLIFNDDITLDHWLKSVEKRSIHSTKTWQRVPSKSIGEEGRKIYDISASYQKGSSAEVVISLFDHSDIYQPEDDELDFIAFAAHELRGPITVIRGYLDVLGDELGDTLDKDQKELLSRLVVSANRLSGYVNNILNASRYDRRHLSVYLREDTIAGIYDSIQDDMVLRAHSQNRMLSVSFPGDLPTVAADRGSASEVLSNLIDNALKYSHEGGVVNITAFVEGEFVHVSIQDYGIGMPASIISSLFHKFYRSHRSRETVAGTGIGLYISKAIVESHGGQVSVRSVEGEGSTFGFTLPIYSTVAEKIQAGGGSNENLITKDSDGWIKNHAMFRG